MSETAQEINHSIAEYLFGWKWYDHKTTDKDRKTLCPPDWTPGDLRRDYNLVPDYCGSIEQAFKVVEKLLEKDGLWLDLKVEFTGKERGCSAQFIQRPEGINGSDYCDADNPATAICLAALRTIEEKCTI